MNNSESQEVNAATVEYEVGMFSACDHLTDVLTELAPKVEQHFGDTNTDAHHMLLSVALFYANGHIIEKNLQPNAVRNLAKDLINNKPEALAMREAQRVVIACDSNESDVFEQEYNRLLTEKGLSRSDIELEYQNGNPEKDAQIQELIRKTEVYRLALADQILAHYEVRTTLESWAKLYWPKHTKTSIRRTNHLALLPADLKFANDNIHSATIRGLALASQWHEGDEYHRGITQNFRNVKVTLSLPNGEKAESEWAFLRKGGPAMIKAHYALWARYFEQTDGLAIQYITVDINQFCSDLGYSKSTKGGYKARDKQHAVRFLEVLTAVEMSATYQDKKDKKLKRLRGPIWARGIVAEEADGYDDLFGAAREGNPELWTPRSFSYAPGPWHADEDWRRYNRYVGKIGAGLMNLNNSTDEWAILIGGYLGTLARTVRYAPKRLKIGPMLKAVGLAQSKNAQREATKYREKLFTALDKLKEIGVVAAWELDKVSINDPAENDPDNTAAWAEYAQQEIYPPGDWRGWIVSITFPQDEDRERLAGQKSKAITQKKRRRVPAKKSTQEE